MQVGGVWGVGVGVGGEEKCMKNVSPTLFDYALSLGRVPQTWVLTGVPSLFKAGALCLLFLERLVVFFSQRLFSALPVPANRNLWSTGTVCQINVSCVYPFLPGAEDSGSVCLKSLGEPQFELCQRLSLLSASKKKRWVFFFFCYFWGTVQRLLNLVV